MGFRRKRELIKNVIKTITDRRNRGSGKWKSLARTQSIVTSGRKFRPFHENALRAQEPPPHRVLNYFVFFRAAIANTLRLFPPTHPAPSVAPCFHSNYTVRVFNNNYYYRARWGNIYTRASAYTRWWGEKIISVRILEGGGVET